MELARIRLSRKNVLRIFLYLLLLLIVSVGLLILLVRAGAFGALPEEDTLLGIRNPIATEIYSSDGKLMGTYHIQNRQYLDPGSVPKTIRDALVATEDARFYTHNGIDYRSLGRVLIKSIILQNNASGGGSTLTQQLVKNLFPRGTFGVLSMPVNKLKEMMIARRMEKIYTKEEILVLYLSTVPFGENTFGLQSASIRYFNKESGSLSIDEAAILVGMLKATATYNPVWNPDKARERRNVVLSQMARYDYLDATAADSLQQLPVHLDYHPLPHDKGIAPYFREFLRKELEQWCRDEKDRGRGSYNIYTDGLRVYTTIDSRLQEYAETAVSQHMARLQEQFEQQWKGRDLWRGISESALLINYEGMVREDMEKEAPHEMEVFTWEGPEVKTLNTLDSIKHYLKFLQTGFLAMDTETARIRAWVGGIDHRYFKYDHVLAKRQVGSTFKPLVYLEALRQGISPCDYFANDSIVYEDYNGWTPRNADGKYGGYYSMKGALVHSVNTVSVNLLFEVGTDSVIRLARQAGIRAELPAEPSLALGSGEIPLLEMVNAYQAIANDGLACRPIWLDRIEDREGKLLYQSSQHGAYSPICSREEARLMTAMLKKVVEEGTASGIQAYDIHHMEMAGKTGTTQNHTDGWFIGYTPGLVAGAWVGGDLPRIRFRTLGLGQGAHTAMPIWAGFMEQSLRDPTWSSIKSNSFELEDEIRDQLNCEDFRDKKPFQFRPFREFKEKGGFREFFKRRKRRR